MPVDCFLLVNFTPKHLQISQCFLSILYVHCFLQLSKFVAMFVSKSDVVSSLNFLFPLLKPNRVVREVVFGVLGVGVEGLFVFLRHAGTHFYLSQIK